MSTDSPPHEPTPTTEGTTRTHRSPDLPETQHRPANERTTEPTITAPTVDNPAPALATVLTHLTETDTAIRFTITFLGFTLFHTEFCIVNGTYFTRIDSRIGTSDWIPERQHRNGINERRINRNLRRNRNYSYVETHAVTVMKSAA